MSTPPSAGALRAAEYLQINGLIVYSSNRIKRQEQVKLVAATINEHTQAETAGLVDLMGKVATMLEELPEDTMESFMAKSIREALAKIREGAGS